MQKKHVEFLVSGRGVLVVIDDWTSARAPTTTSQELYADMVMLHISFTYAVFALVKDQVIRGSTFHSMHCQLTGKRTHDVKDGNKSSWARQTALHKPVIRRRSSTRVQTRCWKLVNWRITTSRSWWSPAPGRRSRLSLCVAKHACAWYYIVNMERPKGKNSPM